ncbi:MAG: hypothetical protein EOM80_14935 [Erysipelotrichia bacterium]|nr:hypothetical protein [Erysipelotrichia bacterium]
MKKRRGITLLEIMSALLILAFAFIPIFGMIGTGAKDTDISESYIFAQTRARNILDSLLDDVPFFALRVASTNVADIGDTNAEANVGEMFDTTNPNYSVASFVRFIGNDPATDRYARGELLDERGTRYKVKIFVFPVPANEALNVDEEMTFRYLPRPDFEKQADWYTTTAESNSAFVTSTCLTPYQMAEPEMKIKGIRELGAYQGPAGNNYCVMKKILLRIRWTMKSGVERSIEIYTAKANLDRMDL